MPEGWELLVLFRNTSSVSARACWALLLSSGSIAVLVLVAVDELHRRTVGEGSPRLGVSTRRMQQEDGRSQKEQMMMIVIVM
jgi:hypothetical protein